MGLFFDLIPLLPVLVILQESLILRFLKTTPLLNLMKVLHNHEFIVEFHLKSCVVWVGNIDVGKTQHVYIFLIYFVTSRSRSCRDQTKCLRVLAGIAERLFKNLADDHLGVKVQVEVNITAIGASAFQGVEKDDLAFELSSFLIVLFGYVLIIELLLLLVVPLLLVLDLVLEPLLALHKSDICDLLLLLLRVLLELAEFIRVLFPQLLRDGLLVELALLDYLEVDLPLIHLLLQILLEVVLFSGIPPEHVLKSIFFVRR